MNATGKRIPAPRQSAAYQFFKLTRLQPEVMTSPLWDGLLGVEFIKQQLLHYLRLGVWFVEVGIGQEAVARGNAILLVGPPGTGKTVLARGAAEVLVQENNEPAVLLEVDSHRLPSASKGGTQQNVLTLFRDIGEVAMCGLPVIVVINEVETTCGNRAALDPTTNPADTAYAVNAFIEGWDALVREHPNVVFIMTTNLPKSLDRAVLDRCDFTVTTRLPPPEAREAILWDALNPILEAVAASHLKTVLGRSVASPVAKHPHRGDGALAEVVRKSEGMSPRELRKLVIRALTYPDDPSSFSMADLVSATDDYVSQREHHQRTGGQYVVDYQRQDGHGRLPGDCHAPGQERRGDLGEGQGADPQDAGRP